MARKGTGPKRLDEPTLTAADWAEAALQLIAEAGLGGLTVDTLAKRLGVTKGSFYWHFKGRQELLAAALERWEGRIGETITGLSAIPDAAQRIRLMMEAATQPPRARSLYAALAEGAADPVVRKVLSRVAAARVEYLESCYRDAGLEPAQARAKALFAYAAYRGLLQLAHEAPGALPNDWPAYAELVREVLVPAAPAQRKVEPKSRKRPSA